MKSNLDRLKIEDFKLIPNWSFANKMELLIFPYVLIPLFYSFFSNEGMYLGWKFEDWIVFTLIISFPYILVPIIGLFVSAKKYRFKIFLHFYLMGTMTAYLIFGAVGNEILGGQIHIFERMIKYGFLVILTLPVSLGILYSIYEEIEVYIFKHVIIQNELDRSRNSILDLQQRVDEQNKIIEYLQEVQKAVSNRDLNGTQPID